MSDAQEGSEKTHDPTPKRLLDARKDGQVPKSTDLSAAAAYLGLILALTALGPRLISDAGDQLSHFIAKPERFSLNGGELDGASVSGFVGSIALFLIAPVFMVPAVAVLLSLVVQRAIVFAPKKLQPKLNKISPLAAAKKKFGGSGLFEFAKSVVKLAVVGLLMVWFIRSGLAEMLQSVGLGPPQLARMLGTRILDFLTLLFALSLVIGGVDILWQNAEHIRKNRMTRKEVEDESKEAEGDPHNKQARRQRAYEIAMNQMLADVPGATVVVVNPTHYAVALNWETQTSGAPICVAKGVDEIAARIREIAYASSIPIYRDPATARSLFARIEVGQEVWPDDYRAVAAAIRFAQSLQSSAKREK